MVGILIEGCRCAMSWRDFGVTFDLALQNVFYCHIFRQIYLIAATDYYMYLDLIVLLSLQMYFSL